LPNGKESLFSVTTINGNGFEVFEVPYGIYRITEVNADGTIVTDYTVSYSIANRIVEVGLETGAALTIINSTEYNFLVYMESAQTSLKIGDALYVDIMLTGNLNYSQVNTAIAFDGGILEFAGHENLGGIAAEVKKDGADRISVRSVSNLNMFTGAPCKTPVRVATLKFTVKGILESGSINTNLTFASIAVTPVAGITGTITAPGNALNVILTR